MKLLTLIQYLSYFADSEKLVQEALDNLLTQNNATTVIIAHRLSTVRNADRIAVIDCGRVVEQGAHKDLMKISDGVYRKMVEGASEAGLFPD